MKNIVPTDTNDILERMIAGYEERTGRTLQPADPERLFLSFFASAIVQERVYQNYAASQNLPGSAIGDNLDALGEWIFDLKRKDAQAAKCIVRFTIAQAVDSAVAIPAGTRVTDQQRKLYWATTTDAAIPPGQTYADVMVECLTVGLEGNGYLRGQICVLVDTGNIIYFHSCSNVTETDGGSDRETDAEYLAQMQRRLSAFSTAGSEASYIYWAKSVSDDIADVRAIRPLTSQFISASKLFPGTESDDKFAFVGGEQISIPSVSVYAALPNASRLLEEGTDYTIAYDGSLLIIDVLATGSGISAEAVRVFFHKVQTCHVNIYALMKDGTPASDTIKHLIAEACNADSVRPLTDEVSVNDPEIIPFNVNATFYISKGTQVSLLDVQTKVNAATDEYIAWQQGKLGRDINPSKLHSLLMGTGIKRVEIASPAYWHLTDGDDGSPPALPQVGSVSLTFGGYEDE